MGPTLKIALRFYEPECSAAKRSSEKLAPRDVIVIGDNIRDVQAGQAIGATTIAVASGPMSYEQLQATGPDHIFHDLSDTPAVMKILL